MHRGLCEKYDLASTGNEKGKASLQSWNRTTLRPAYPRGNRGRRLDRYLGILQFDQALNTNITSEYIRRVKKLCRSKLNGGNLISGINTWGLGVVRYGAGIVD